MTAPGDGAPGRWAVKVRASSSHWWTSPWLLEDDARATARNLRRDLGSHSDGSGLLDFKASSGREVAIRARDVVAIELVPWHEGPPSTADAAAVVVPHEGTAFLRRRAAAEAGAR